LFAEWFNQVEIRSRIQAIKNPQLALAAIWGLISRTYQQQCPEQEALFRVF